MENAGDCYCLWREKGTNSLAMAQDAWNCCQNRIGLEGTESATGGRGLVAMGVVRVNRVPSLATQEWLLMKSLLPCRTFFSWQETSISIWFSSGGALAGQPPHTSTLLKHGSSQSAPLLYLRPSLWGLHRTSPSSPPGHRPPARHAQL